MEAAKVSQTSILPCWTMTLPEKVHLRDQLIRQLWVVLRDISEEEPKNDL